MTSPPAFAVSTWSLHRTIGITYDQAPGASPNPTAKESFGAGILALEDLPRALAAHGFYRVELCHFHLAQKDAAYLAALRQNFAAHGVVIQTLLIDDGDLTDPTTAARDLTWIKGWIDVAGLLGAENARLVAGKRKPDAITLKWAVDGLSQAVAHAKAQWPHLRIVTENWFDLLSTPAAVAHVLAQVPGLGFLADTGNWQGPTKQADLTAIFAPASLCHFKIAFAADQHPDSTDLRLCLAAANAAHYAGPLTLIFDSAGDEWQGLARLRDAVLAHQN